MPPVPDDNDRPSEGAVYGLHAQISFAVAVGIISVVGITLTVGIMFVISQDARMESVSSIPSPEEKMRLPLPARLKIPKIGVDAEIEHVGISPDGSMDKPSKPGVAGWFELGTRPGEKGSAVISGHYGWKDNIPAIFDQLHALEKGDTIFVEDTRGVMVTFIVRELRTFDEHAEASDVFTSGDGEAHLNLITCKGVWNKTTKSYSKRLIVFTNKES